jgi:ABC-2 type transport system ATP-binding protein
VTVLGLPAGHPRLRARLGYATQAPAVYPDLTLGENLRYFGTVLGLRGRRLAEAIAATVDRLDLAGVGKRLVGTFSGGQLARVGLAVALLGRPDLLILDEPTVAMDVEGRREFWTIMRAFAARGKTVLFATHYLEEADANADRAILMAHGRIVADGPTTEIKARVGRRTLRATLPAVDPAKFAELPGVASAERHGDAVILSCSDSDQTIRAILEHYPQAKDIEIVGAGLEAAFLELTGEPDVDAPEVLVP